MHYGIRHITRFTYSATIRESVMEVRLQPRSDLCQRSLRFELATEPRASVSSYTDPFGNLVHHFDIPGAHRELMLTAESIVEFVSEVSPLPSIGLDGWQMIDESARSAEGWEMLQDSTFARRTPRLEELATSIGAGRHLDPSSAVLALTAAVHGQFEYRRESTRVDSPIDEAIATRQGVCQDFAHVLIALLRRSGIPSRYVSGYLFHGRDERPAEGAMHAWVEVLLPGGWIGLDPTLNRLAGSAHVRVAIGRDYADITPTKGVYKGDASGELAVAVHMSQNGLPPPSTKFSPVLVWTMPAQDSDEPAAAKQQQQQ
jgi:transglutaminase-like putative cysteine protease